MTSTEGQDPLRSPGPEEADPTGIRDLLRTLPGPGPMPDDLVERISARLSLEQTQRLQDPGAATGRAGDRVVDLTEQRSRRRPGRVLAYLGVAAAGLLVATVAVDELAGGGLLDGTAGPGSAAQVSSQSRAASDVGGGADAGGDHQAMDGQAGATEELSADGQAGAGDEGGAPAAAAAPDQEIEVLPPLGEITAGTVRSDVLAGLARATVPPSSAPDTLSVSGAARCWQIGGDGRAWPERQAAEAVYEGKPVVVLVGRDGDTGTAVLLPASCTHGAHVDALQALAWGS